MVGVAPAKRCAITFTACAARAAASVSPYSPVAAPARASAEAILPASKGATVPSRLSTACGSAATARSRALPIVVSTIRSPTCCYWRRHSALRAGGQSRARIDGGQPWRRTEAMLRSSVGMAALDGVFSQRRAARRRRLPQRREGKNRGQGWIPSRRVAMGTPCAAAGLCAVVFALSIAERRSRRTRTWNSVTHVLRRFCYLSHRPVTRLSLGLFPAVAIDEFLDLTGRRVVLFAFVLHQVERSTELCVQGVGRVAHDG